jgi:hypothetical protein
VFGRCLLCHADAGEGAQQAIQSIGICLTVFGQETNATYLVSKCIGNAEACSRAKHTAAGIRHCHLYEPCIRRYIADATAELNHETPPKFSERISEEPQEMLENRMLPTKRRNPDLIGWDRSSSFLELTAKRGIGNCGLLIHCEYPTNRKQLRKPALVFALVPWLGYAKSIFTEDNYGNLHFISANEFFDGFALNLRDCGEGVRI